MKIVVFYLCFSFLLLSTTKHYLIVFQKRWNVIDKLVYIGLIPCNMRKFWFNSPPLLLKYKKIKKKLKKIHVYLKNN